jgi:hypothetical protein
MVLTEVLSTDFTLLPSLSKLNDALLKVTTGVEDGNTVALGV